MQISPSILAADLCDLRSHLEGADPRIVDYWHLDVMDGHFVPTLSFGEMYAKAVKKHTDIPLDIHLMVERPEKEVPKYFELQPHNITFHLESTHFPVRLARQIRDAGIRAGIALNPGTALSLLEPLLGEIDLLLIMTVEPGFYGQKFLPFCLQKIEQARAMIPDGTLLQVDGGVSSENIPSLYQKGADICAAGSACFRGNQNENIQILKDKIRSSSNTLDR